MTEAEVEKELQNLQFQLVLLQEEHAKTRSSWLYLLRVTGFLLLAFGITTAIALPGAALAQSSPSGFSGFRQRRFSLHPAKSVD